LLVGLESISLRVLQQFSIIFILVFLVNASLLLGLVKQLHPLSKCWLLFFLSISKLLLENLRLESASIGGSAAFLVSKLRIFLFVLLASLNKIVMIRELPHLILRVLLLQEFLGLGASLRSEIRLGNACDGLVKVTLLLVVKKVILSGSLHKNEMLDNPIDFFISDNVFTFLECAYFLRVNLKFLLRFFLRLHPGVIKSEYCAEEDLEIFKLN
jgi:hypothetical protein